MDMVNWSEQVFMNIKSDLEKLSERLNVEDVRFIPISAKYGDNVVEASENMGWYKGELLLRLLETIEIKKEKNSGPARFPVQTVIRPSTSEFHDYRGYAGRMAGGSFTTGDMITVLPSGQRSKIKSIDVMGKSVGRCNAGDSVSILLEDDIDISRGDILASANELPEAGQEITLMICWFSGQPLKEGGKYLVRTGTSETGCIMKKINYKVNIDTLDNDFSDKDIKMNDIASITIKTSKPLFFDSYRKNNITGSMIFIDEGTNETIAAGMII
jgi:sulfate adenylyltransferase subunit 1